MTILPNALLGPPLLYGSVLGNMKNLCPDSSFKYAPLASGNPRNDNAGGPPTGVSPVFLYTWYPDFFYTGAVQPGWVFSQAFNWQVSNFSGSGGAYGAVFNNALGAGTLTQSCISVPFSLVANTPHTLSCYMDASMLTSGSIAIAVFNWTNASGVGTQVAALGMNAGSSGRVSLVITPPSTTSQTFVMVLDTNGAGFNAQGSLSGYSAIWTEPQLEMGSLMTAYEESFTAGAVGTDGGVSGNRSWGFFGNLPASVQQVVDPSGTLVAGVVTSAAIASGAVGSSKLASSAVTSSALAANSVTSSAIAAGAVGNSELASGAVATSNLASSAIDFTQSAKFANKTLDNVADGTTRFAVNSVDGQNRPDHVAATTQFGAGTPGPTITFGSYGLTGGSLPAASGFAQGSIIINTAGNAGSRLWYRTGVPSWVADSSL